MNIGNFTSEMSGWRRSSIRRFWWAEWWKHNFWFLQQRELCDRRLFVPVIVLSLLTKSEFVGEIENCERFMRWTKLRIIRNCWFEWAEETRLMREWI
jgi:hypothetical protein